MTNDAKIQRALNQAIHGISEIKVYDPDGEEYATRTVDEILEGVNDAHSEDFTEYDHNDWVEGTLEFGFWKPIFPKGQKFWWTDCDRENPCDKFVTLADETVVSDMGDIMQCEEGEFPMCELTPILEDDNHPFEQVGNYHVWVAYDNHGKASYFVTDLDGYELADFHNIPDAKQYIATIKE